MLSDMFCLLQKDLDASSAMRLRHVYSSTLRTTANRGVIHNTSACPPIPSPCPCVPVIPCPHLPSVYHVLPGTRFPRRGSIDKQAQLQAHRDLASSWLILRAIVRVGQLVRVDALGIRDASHDCCRLQERHQSVWPAVWPITNAPSTTARLRQESPHEYPDESPMILEYQPIS